MSLHRSAEDLKHWAINAALPFWLRAQRKDGSWVEHLNLDKTPDRAAERRWRVLARQIYVYAEAARLGWYKGEDIARLTYVQMREIGYVQRVTSDGQPAERRRDLYDHAFYLLASAALYRATHNTEFLDAANEILETLDRDFTHPMTGWRETPRGRLPRRQNPHMHLFEASLYLFSETRNPEHLLYANRIFSLFENYFFDKKTLTIREYFNEDWSTLKGTQGDIAEPGHAMEWVWLLYQYQCQSGTDTSQYRKALYTRALKGRRIFLNDEEDIYGTIRRDSKRLWVQTEVIKAHLAMAEDGSAKAREQAQIVMEHFRNSYLNRDGSWNDQLSESGQLIAKTIPVSSFYHILCMISEAVRISRL